MEHDNDNKIFQEEPSDEYEYKYNFVSTPWDDRTSRSKKGIICLLLSIFIATFACVAYNLYGHFLTLNSKRSMSSDNKCNLVKVDQYRFAARIHSLDTRELLCVGAVISPSSVVANEVCVKSGTVRLSLGSPTDPRCKKGFSVDEVEPIYHEGTVTKHVVLLTSYDKMADCSEVIEMGDKLDWNSPAYIIGRPLRGGRSLSRQPVNLAQIENLTGFAIRNLNLQSMVCVKDLGKCPVRAGDLLLQGGRVFGVAATSTHAAEHSSLACFADLRMVSDELKEHSE